MRYLACLSPFQLQGVLILCAHNQRLQSSINQSHLIRYHAAILAVVSPSNLLLAGEVGTGNLLMLAIDAALILIVRAASGHTSLGF